MSSLTPKTVVPIIAVESVDEIRSFHVESLGPRIMFARAPGKRSETKAAAANRQ